MAITQEERINALEGKVNELMKIISIGTLTLTDRFDSNRKIVLEYINDDFKVKKVMTSTEETEIPLINITK